MVLRLVCIGDWVLSCSQRLVSVVRLDHPSPAQLFGPVRYFLVFTDETLDCEDLGFCLDITAPHYNNFSSFFFR